MALKLKTKQETIGSIESNLGHLNIFTLTRRDQKKLYKSLGDSVSKVTPDEYIKSLITEVCYFDNELINGKYRPNEPSSIKIDDLNQLRNEDLENIAKIYTQNNEWLFTETILKPKKEKDGTAFLQLEDSEIVPKEEGESYVNYLHRLSIIEENKFREYIKELSKSYANITEFSNNLNKSINESLLIGETLKQQIGSIELTNYNAIDHFESLKKQNEKRLEPFNNLAGKLDEIIETSGEVTNFLVEMNKNQVGISQELKKSGDSAEKFSKVNIFLSIIIIILTVIPIMVSYKTSKNNSLELEFKKVTNEYVENIIHEIDSLNKMLLDNNELSKKNTSILINEMKQLSIIRIGQLENEISKQNKMIDDLKVINKNNTSKIQLLEDKIKQLSNK